MAVDLRRVRRLVDAHAAARRRITDRFTAALQRRWRAARPRFYDPTWVDESARWSADLARTAADTWAQQAARHIELQLAEIDARFAATERQRRELVLPDRYRDVDPMVQWRRPANEFRWLISQGIDQDEALDRAVRRAVQIGEMEVQLADRAGSEARLKNPTGSAATPTITGYRRVTHPELSRGGVCGLCIAAADRLYTLIETRAVHDGCHCTVLAVVGDNDPGSQLNAEDLAKLYKAAGDSTDRQDLAKTRWKIEEHSELGPVLVQQGHHFKTLAEVDAERSGEREVDESRQEPAVLRYRPDDDPEPDDASDQPPPADPPGTGQRTPDPEPDPEDREAWLAYWKSRQDAIEADSDGRFRSNGETLEAAEVRFVERFLALGHSLSWIPKDPNHRPSNDFVWTDRAEVVELKATKALHGTILRAVTRATVKAERQGVVKDFFVIDIGDNDLDDDLRSALARYNQDRQRNQIRALWIMHAGVLTEIDLE